MKLNPEMLTDKKIERIERKPRKMLKAMATDIDLWFESETKVIRKIKKIADEFHKANQQTGNEDKRIALEIAKALRTQIEEGKITVQTICDTLDRKYKLQEKSTRKKPAGKISVAKDEDDDLLDKEIRFMRHAAGLSPTQIFEMSIDELLVKMESYYSIELQSLNAHDIHLQSKILDYIVPLTRKMLEMTEAKRAALKSQEERGIGEV